MLSVSDTFRKSPLLGLAGCGASAAPFARVCRARRALACEQRCWRQTLTSAAATLLYENAPTFFVGKRIVSCCCCIRGRFHRSFCVYPVVVTLLLVCLFFSFFFEANVIALLVCVEVPLVSSALQVRRTLLSIVAVPCVLRFERFCRVATVSVENKKLLSSDTAHVLFTAFTHPSTSIFYYDSSSMPQRRLRLHRDLVGMCLYVRPSKVSRSLL